MGFKNSVILISTYGMGSGPQDLSLTLISKYLELLNSFPNKPAAICFYNEGVKLVVENSPVLDRLRSLEEGGVRLVVCSTCLNYFSLSDKVMVGIVGGMGDIIEAQEQAEKVIHL